ncbi:AAA family ATPase [Salinicola tamaricis]|uniref:AAA family ATPase n=1 Tax=Salinicola tamaricis TaxID=1771309 RepID=UPI000D0A03D6|nr:AAA family ATPase [Salinicola tamaricis]
MVMDMAAKMAELNPDSPRILETSGVVMIDEIDLHLHPSWQQKILHDLRKTFPNVQFIVTTHSPQVLTSVDARSIRIVGEDSIESPSVNTLGEKSGAVLSSIFSVSEWPPEEVADNLRLLNEYRTLVSSGAYDTQEALKLRAALDEVYGHSHEELVRCDLYQKRLKFLKEKKKGEM